MLAQHCGAVPSVYISWYKSVILSYVSTAVLSHPQYHTICSTSKSGVHLYCNVHCMKASVYLALYSALHSNYNVVTVSRFIKIENICNILKLFQAKTFKSNGLAGMGYSKVNAEATHSVLLFWSYGDNNALFIHSRTLFYLANTICQFLLTWLDYTHAYSLASWQVPYWRVCSVICYPLCTLHDMQKTLWCRSWSKKEYCKLVPLCSACWKMDPTLVLFSGEDWFQLLRGAHNWVFSDLF